jgi:acyl-CoA reductase-like NAD-dependent aldehyde dehydrogenase
VGRPLSPWERAKVCHAIADLIAEQREQFACELSLEQAKPYSAEALADGDAAAALTSRRGRRS